MLSSIQQFIDNTINSKPGNIPARPPRPPAIADMHERSWCDDDLYEPTSENENGESDLGSVSLPSQSMQCELPSEEMVTEGEPLTSQQAVEVDCNSESD